MNFGKNFSWSYALINGRLADIYFTKDKLGRVRFLGHGYLEKCKFTKKDKEIIEKDIHEVRLSYRNGQYHRIKQKSSSTFRVE